MSAHDGNVLLIFPPADANYGSGDLKRKDIKFKEANNICPPLGLLYIAAILRRGGYMPRLLDCSARVVTDAEFMCECKKTTVMGVHIQTNQRLVAQRMIKMARKANPTIRIITGGPDCHSYGRLEEGTDLSLRGETELTILSAVTQLLSSNPDFSDIPGAVYRDENGRVVSNAIAPPMTELDSVPFPDRSIVDRRLYSLLGAFRGRTTAVLTARGCNGSCSFCERRFYSFYRYRPRSTENVIDEFEEIDKLGYRYLYINDDNFLAQRERAALIAEGLIRRRSRLSIKILSRVDDIDDEICALLSRAGVRFIDLGLETPNEEVLRFYQKRTNIEQIRSAVLACDRHGILVHGHVMFGAPMETKDDLIKTIDMVCSLPVDSMFLNILGYRKESALWRRAVDASLISSDENVVVATRERGLGLYSEEELRQLHDWGIRRFYLRYVYFKRQIMKLASIGDLRFKMAMVRIFVNLTRSLLNMAITRVFL